MHFSSRSIMSQSEETEAVVVVGGGGGGRLSLSQPATTVSRKRSLPLSRNNNNNKHSTQGHAKATTTAATAVGIFLSVATMAVSGFQNHPSFLHPATTSTTTHTSMHNNLLHPHNSLLHVHNPHRSTTAATRSSLLQVLADPTRLADATTTPTPVRKTRNVSSPSSSSTAAKAKRKAKKNIRVVAADRAALEDMYALQSALEKLEENQRLLQSSMEELEDTRRIDGGSSSSSSLFVPPDDAAYDFDHYDQYNDNSQVLSSSSSTGTASSNIQATTCVVAPPPPAVASVATPATTSSATSKRGKITKAETAAAPKKSIRRTGRVTIKRPSQSSRKTPSVSSSSSTMTTPSFVSKKEETILHQLQERSSVSAEGQRFPGLTVNPKRKNRKKRKSLTTVPPTYRNPYMYPIPDAALGTTQAELVQLMEEELQNDKEEDLEENDGPLDVTATEIFDDLDGDEMNNSGSSTSLLKDAKKTKSRTLIPSSRSSTMYGYGQTAVTNRQKAFDDGIKLYEERTGQKLIESAEAKTKRKNSNGVSMYRNSASVPESLMRFANEIHVVDRITAKEEKELGAKTQEAIRLQEIYDGLQKKLARKPTDEEWLAASGKINMEAISQVIEEGLEAKNRLVISNLRMVQGVVNVYIRNGLQGNFNSGDLMQEGIMALIRAAEKFDPSRGFRFSTYAMYWIRSAIKRDHTYQSRVVTVPQRLHDEHKRLIRTQGELKVALKRNPTKRELADATGYTTTQIDRVLDAIRQQSVSLDQNLVNHKKKSKGDDSNDTLYSIVNSKVDESEYESSVHKHLRDDLINTLNQHLTEEQAYVLMLRFGLVHGDSPQVSNKSGLRTFAEVSRLAGLKPDKVRRLIQQSLQHLHSVMGDEWNDYQLELQQQ